MDTTRNIVGREQRWIKKVLNRNISYSFKEALVHKICNISSLFPKTYNVEIDNNGSSLVIEMETLYETPRSLTSRGIKDIFLVKVIEQKVSSWLRILQAVALLNYFNIAHRDIKSENVMYRRSNGGDEAVLIDFGLSKVLIGESHTPDVVSEYYRAPELYSELETLKYGLEIDSWALGIWALELFNKKFHPMNFLEQWKQNKYDHYLTRVPEKIRPIVESFLLPVGERKITLDWIEIDKDKKLFHYPEDYDLRVPEKAKEWSLGYKAIRWNLDEYNYTDDEKAIITMWMTSQLFMPYPIPLKKLCKPYNLDEKKVYGLALAWFVNFKLS